MNIVHAEYNKYHNIIDINYYNGYILRIDCGKAEDGLITTPNSQRMLDALAIDNPLEYARLYLDSEMQDWVNAMNMEWYSTCQKYFYKIRYFFSPSINNEIEPITHNRNNE